jgi:hypothetical protein
MHLKHLKSIFVKRTYDMDQYQSGSPAYITSFLNINGWKQGMQYEMCMGLCARYALMLDNKMKFSKVYIYNNNHIIISKRASYCRKYYTIVYIVTKLSREYVLRYSLFNFEFIHSIDFRTSDTKFNNYMFELNRKTPHDYICYVIDRSNIRLRLGWDYQRSEISLSWKSVVVFTILFIIYLILNSFICYDCISFGSKLM